MWLSPVPLQQTSPGSNSIESRYHPPGAVTNTSLYPVLEALSQKFIWVKKLCNLFLQCWSLRAGLPLFQFSREKTNPIEKYNGIFCIKVSYDSSLSLDTEVLISIVWNASKIWLARFDDISLIKVWETKTQLGVSFVRVISQDQHHHRDWESEECWGDHKSQTSSQSQTQTCPR